MMIFKYYSLLLVFGNDLIKMVFSLNQTFNPAHYPYDGVNEDLRIGISTVITSHGCVGGAGSATIHRAAADINMRNSTYCPAISKLRNNFTIGIRIFDTVGN